MKTILYLLLVLSTLFAKDSDTIVRVGVYENPPKIFLDSQNKPSGFFIDILDEIAKNENWQMQYTFCEWNECLNKLQKNEIDIMPDVAFTVNRANDFSFNEEVVLVSHSVLFSNQKTNISSVMALKNKKAAILKNSIQHTQLNDFISNFGIKIEYIFTNSFEEAFELVDNGKADVIATSKYYGEYNKQRFKNIVDTSIVLYSAPLKFAFCKDANNTQLIDKIDKNLVEFKKSTNSILQIATKKYLLPPEVHKLPTWFYKVVLLTIIAIVFLITLATFFKYLLKKRTKEVVEKSNEILELQTSKTNDYKNMLFALVSMVEQRDSYTAGHSQRVAKYTQMIAKEMGYAKETLELLYQASMLHDIGKIATPDAILLKPDKLNALEYDIIKEHVNVSVAILKDIEMCKDIVEIIKYHHEKYNGSGYPSGAKGDDIPNSSRIMMIADAFDAMTTNRIYRHKKSVNDALCEIKSLSGIHFHPEVVEVALRVLKDVDTSQDFNQKPTTSLEEHRFVYFYKDPITNLYNSKYLEQTISNSHNEEKYQEVAIVSLHYFDILNKKYGWDRGDEILSEFATLLNKIFQDTTIFRVRANDFIILSKESQKDNKNIYKIEEFITEAGLSFSINFYNLKNDKINSYENLKFFL